MSVSDRPGVRWWLAYTFLLLTVHEAHELVHAVTARAICGVWPERDFNAWRIVGECSSWAPTAAGPLFSYLVMAAGAWLALRAKGNGRWAGLALLFAGNPFARIFTVALGGGDEMVVAQRIADLATRTLSLRLVVLAVVGAVCGTAIVSGWRAMQGLWRRAVWFSAIMLWPMVVTGTLFVVGNRLLRQGVLADASIAGTPRLVLLSSVLFAVIAAMTATWLFPARRPPLPTRA